MRAFGIVWEKVFERCDWGLSLQELCLVTSTLPSRPGALEIDGSRWLRIAVRGRNPRFSQSKQHILSESEIAHKEMGRRLGTARKRQTRETKDVANLDVVTCRGRNV